MLKVSGPWWKWDSTGLLLVSQTRVFNILHVYLLAFIEIMINGQTIGQLVIYLTFKVLCCKLNQMYNYLY